MACPLPFCVISSNLIIITAPFNGGRDHGEYVFTDSSVDLTQGPCLLEIISKNELLVKDIF